MQIISIRSWMVWWGWKRVLCLMSTESCRQTSPRAKSLTILGRELNFHNWSHLISMTDNEFIFIPTNRQSFNHCKTRWGFKLCMQIWLMTITYKRFIVLKKIGTWFCILKPFLCCWNFLKSINFCFVSFYEPTAMNWMWKSQIMYEWVSCLAIVSNPFYERENIPPKKSYHDPLIECVTVQICQRERSLSKPISDYRKETSYWFFYDF